MEWTTVEWPLGGVDAFTDAKHVQPGKLAQVVNGRFDSPPGINKRYGFYTLTRAVNDVDEDTTPPAITEGVRLDVHLNEPILFTQRDMYGYSPVLEAWTWKGVASDALVTKGGGYYDQGVDIQSGSVSINGSYTLMLWGSLSSETLAFTASVTDVHGNVVHKGSEQYYRDPRCFPLGVYHYIIMLDAGTVPPTFRITRFDSTAAVVIIPSTQAFSPSINVGSDEGPGIWDAREMERLAPNPTRRFLLAYAHGTGPAIIRVKLFDNAAPPVELWTRDIAEEPIHFLTVWGREAEHVFVAWGNSSSQVRCAILNESTGAIVGSPITVASLADFFAVRGSFIRHSSQDVILAWQWCKEAAASPPPPPSLALPHTRWRRIRNTGSAPAVQGTERVLYDCALVTRPFSDAPYGRYFIGVCFHESEQGTGFVIEIGNSTDGETDPRWSCTFGRLTTSGFESSTGATIGATGAAKNMLSNVYDLFHPLSSSARQYHFASLQKHKFSKVRKSTIKGDLDEIRFHRGVADFGIDFGSIDRFQAASWDRGYFIAAGRPSWYDTMQVAEHGFAWYPSYDRDRTGPSDDDITDVAGGTLQSTGDVQVVATYEHEDANAMRTISGTSRVMTESITVNNERLRITRTTSLLTDRSAQKPWVAGTSRAREVFYRTTVSGTEFFRAHTHVGFQIPPDNAEYQIHLAESGFEDQADAEIVDNEQLYTTGDILINDGTPPCRFAVVHGDRMWIGGLENRKEMWFSQPYVSTDTPRFNGNLRLRFSHDIINAESMDDKLVCFSDDRIFIVTGDGPSAAGGVDIGFRIQLVTSDVGLKDLRSLIAMRDGLMFRDFKGIYLLDRGLGLHFKGKDVSDLLVPIDTIVGAAVESRSNEVHFVVAPGSAEADSFALVYNYLLDQWSKDEYSFRATSCVMIPNPGGFAELFAVLQSNGMVHVRDTSAWADPGDPNPVFISLRHETPWIKPSTLLQGASAIRKMLFLGQLPGVIDCQIRVRIWYDYESTYDEEQLFTEAELQVLVESVTSSAFQIEYTPGRQQCQAFKIQIFDEDSGDGPNEGYSLQSMVFEVGRMEGTARTRKEARH